MEFRAPGGALPVGKREPPRTIAPSSAPYRRPPRQGCLPSAPSQARGTALEKLRGIDRTVLRRDKLPVVLLFLQLRIDRVGAQLALLRQIFQRLRPGAAKDVLPGEGRR